MNFRGKYENEAGIFRPYISTDVLSPANEWVIVDFLLDTGADETFLDFSFIKKFDIDTKGIDVKDDVGGVGGPGEDRRGFPAPLRRRIKYKYRGSKAPAIQYGSTVASEIEALKA